MKHKIFNYAAGFLTIALLTTSCVDDAALTQLDPNNDSVDKFWSTEQDAVEGLNAAYSSLMNDGSYMRSTPLLLDVKSDDSRSNSPWPAMANVARFNSNVTNAEIYGWAYETYYQGINRANQVLTSVPKIAMDENLKNRVLGQAYFLRGLYFFHAVNMFKNVPLPTDLAVYYPQKTQEEGWAQVISDFKMAAELLPVTYEGLNGIDTKDSKGNTIKGRATKGAALGYLGKAYLFTKDFANAKTTFKQVIDLGVYSLVPNYRDNFTDTNENNSESLFEVQFSREAGGVALSWGGIPASNWGKTSARAITYAPRAFGWTDVQPTWALFNEFQEEKTVSGALDPRLDATIFYKKPGGATPIYQTTFEIKYKDSPTDLNDIFCRKYQNGDGAFLDEYDWRSGINERLLRYADILLMYAECLNETGDTAGAYTYIQMVRDRVGLPNLSTVKPGLSKEGMREQIGHERFLEFPLEGHRFDDIRRWGWLENPTKLAWLKSRDPEFDSYAPGREYFPIPQLDMDNNPGMTQNPSY